MQVESQTYPLISIWREANSNTNKKRFYKLNNKETDMNDLTSKLVFSTKVNRFIASLRVSK